MTMADFSFDIEKEVGSITAGRHLLVNQHPTATNQEKGFRNWYANMQHVHVAEAMLLAMRGTCGAIVYSRFENGGIRFVISEKVDREAADFLQPLLRMASDRAMIWQTAKRLTTAFTYGLLNQSFGYALLDICLGIHELVCTVWDIVTINDPLPTLLHELVPYKPLLALTAEIVKASTDSEGEPIFGTHLLCMLESILVTAQKYPNGVHLCQSIYNQTAIPFLKMISEWIYEGELSVFAAAELPLIRPSESDFMTWMFDTDKIPVFMKSCAEKALQSGKLVRIMAKAGKEYLPLRMELTTNVDQLTSAIEAAWVQANDATLEMLRDDCQLFNLLDIHHRYSLCGESNWLVAFLDGCSTKKNCSLSRTSREVNWIELKQLLHSVIPPKDSFFEPQLAVANSQLFRCLRGKSTFANTSLPLLVSLQLKLDVEWPSSIIFGPQSASKYNFMFRLFFRVKTLKHDLGKCRRRRFALSKAASILLYAMLSLLQSLETYLAYEVVEPQYQKLIRIAKTTTTVEELVDAHNAFMEACLTLSLAHNEVYLKQLDKVFLSIRLFSEAAQYDLDTLMVARFEKQFSERFQELFSSLQADGEKPGGHLIQHLIRRLDFNNFYRKQRSA
eukprot:TRINITY_DN5989_c0_g1_i1.p1 TRINITY_DN5989_c0_g1~~TRINITY_DN5989_c0_g1_i1.p1  ORF type:complete len:624 (+),score=91.06 TRINITY_DN5989_c0_g1_i1:23-1873(+)